MPFHWKVPVHGVNQILKLFGVLYADEGRLPGGIEALAKREALLQQLQSVKGLSQVLLGDGEEIQSGTSIRVRVFQFLDGGDFPAHLGGIGGLSQSAFDFARLLLRGGTADKERKKQDQRRGESPVPVSRRGHDASIDATRRQPPNQLNICRTVTY